MIKEDTLKRMYVDDNHEARIQELENKVAELEETLRLTVLTIKAQSETIGRITNLLERKWG